MTEAKLKKEAKIKPGGVLGPNYPKNSFNGLPGYENRMIKKNWSNLHSIMEKVDFAISGRKFKWPQRPSARIFFEEFLILA